MSPYQEFKKSMGGSPLSSRSMLPLNFASLKNKTSSSSPPSIMNLTHMIAFVFGASLMVFLHSIMLHLDYQTLPIIFLNKSKYPSGPNTTSAFPTFPLSSWNLFSNKNPEQCDFEIVYNKPPKSAGTYVQTLMTKWAAQENRQNILCRGKRAIETSVYLKECIPRSDPSRCSVISAHMFLSGEVRSLLSQRLPSHRLLTSTRYPAHRIVSFFLQLNLLNRTKTRTSNDRNSGLDEEALNDYLTRFNPWSLYNFHAGEKRQGSCPLRLEEINEIFDLASRYDLVVDANLPEQSNIILEHYNLFRFPTETADSDPQNSRKKVNERGTSNLVLSNKTKGLIKKVSCVEDALHKALHLRMASLMETINGQRCIESGRIENLKTCLDHQERKNLQAQWLLD